MSGHSKWATTKHRKAAQDSKRSALFSKLSRNITVAAKEGGDPNPENNASLAAAIEKAKGYSLPKDKIKTAIDKAFGTGKDAASYETVSYEGQGAVLLEAAAEADEGRYPVTLAGSPLLFDWRDMVRAMVRAMPPAPMIPNFNITLPPAFLFLL